MAKKFYNYQSDALGNVPSYITLRRNSVSADYQIAADGGLKFLRYLSASASSAKAASYNEIPCSGVSEAYADIEDIDSSRPASARLALFASDSPDNEYGVYNQDGTLTLYRRVNGSFTSLGTVSAGFNQSVPQRLLLKVSPGTPNTIQAKVWRAVDPEPDIWSIETTDAALTLSTGWAGHVGFAAGAEVRYRAAGFGTDGDPAPREPIPAEGADVELPPASASSVANNPTVSAGASVFIPTTTASANLYSPMVTTAAGVELPTAFADAQSFNIEIAGGAEITLPAASASSLLYPVDARTGAGVLLPAALAQSMAYNQHIASGAAVFVDTAYAGADALDLAVSTGEAQRFVKIVHLAGTYRRSIRL